MTELDSSISEFVGAVIGDGNIWTDGKYRYRVDINGNLELDRKYLIYLSEIIEREFNRKTSLRNRPDKLVLRTTSKKVFDFLTKTLELPFRAGKGKKVMIPVEIISSSWDVTKCCIRGIADTDGSLFFSKKGYRDDYPSIEISTTSKNLAIQLKKILTSRAFRVGFRKQIRRKGWNTRYIISINGEVMLEKWMREIGFSNPRQYQKYEKWKAKKLNQQ